MMKRKMLAAVLATTGLLMSGQSAVAENQISVKELQAEVDRMAVPAIKLYREYLSVPNDGHKPDHIVQLSAWVENAFQSRGFKTSRLATADNPLILAERKHPGATRTVLVYLQADGQPVDPSAWVQDDPYTPVLRSQKDGEWQDIPWESIEGEIDPDWRIFARSASDSKGPNIQFLTALDILKHKGITPDFNLKVVIDTEEEMGSPHLPQAVLDNREALAADMLLIFDGPPHRSGKPTLTFGARGISLVTITAYGPRVPQHSGHFGNYAPNPAFHLSQILASMKSEDGRVLIPGYYDGIEVSDEVREILAAVPDNEAAIRDKIGFKTPDAVAESLQLAVQYPSLNIRGMNSAWIGKQARTIVPGSATAEIDIRLVKESDPERLIGLVRSHIEGLGYTVLDHEPTDAERREHGRLVQFNARTAYRAYRTDFNSDVGRLAYRALVHMNGVDPVRIRTSGGSIPISPFVDTLGIPAVGVPTVNPDNNQHSPNENIRVGNFVEGIGIITGVLAETFE